jgi:hypothetical protein
MPTYKVVASLQHFNVYVTVNVNKPVIIDNNQ